jgi:hypothetical protein
VGSSGSGRKYPLLSRGVEAAVEVLRPPSKCRGCCRGVKAAVEVSRRLSRCQGSISSSSHFDVRSRKIFD